MGRTLFGLLLSLFCFSNAMAGQLAILVNGHAMHLEKSPKEKNEANYGFGIQYDEDPKGDWIPFAFGSGFEDSRNNPSFNAGGGLRKRYMVSSSWHLHADLGVAAMLMTRESYRNGEPFPAVLPVASVGTQRAAMNVAYVPEVDQRIIPLIFFQFMYAVN